MTDSDRALMLALATAIVLLITGTVRFDFWPWGGNYTISAYTFDREGNSHMYALTRFDGGIQHFYIDGSSSFGMMSKERRNARNCGYPGENKMCEWE